MTNKERIRAKIERRVKFHAESSDPLAPAYVSEDNAILFFIDSMQEEPKECMYSKDNYTGEDRKVLCDGCEEECKYAQKEEPVSSIWHDANEPPIIDKTFLLIAPNGNSSLCLWGGEQLHSVTIGGGHSVLCKGDIYSYIDDLLKLYNPCKIGKNLQEEPTIPDIVDEHFNEMLGEEPVSKDFEKIVEEIAEPTILNAYGTKELARRLRNTICGTSVSEGLEEAAHQYYEPNDKFMDGFKKGAKWQKEKDKKKEI